MVSNSPCSINIFLSSLWVRQGAVIDLLIYFLTVASLDDHVKRLSSVLASTEQKLCDFILIPDCVTVIGDSVILSVFLPLPDLFSPEHWWKVEFHHFSAVQMSGWNRWQSAHSASGVTASQER